MIHYLDESRAKIRRAQKHLNSLRMSVEAARAHQRYGVRGRFNVKTQRREVRIHLPPSLSIRWGLLAGEIIHHARSSLDYAVWQAISLNGERPSEGTTGFPIFTKESDYEHRGTRMIKGVNPRVARVIKDLQPFGPNHASDPLWQLNQLWNFDKHRRLNLAVLGAGVYKAAPFARGQIQISVPPLKHGTLISAAPLWVADMTVNEVFSGEITFDEAGPGQGKPLLPILATLVDHALSIVHAIEVAL